METILERYKRVLLNLEEYKNLQVNVCPEYCDYFSWHVLTGLDKFTQEGDNVYIERALAQAEEFLTSEIPF